MKKIKVQRGKHDTLIDAAEDIVVFLKRKKIPHAVGFITTLSGKRSGGIISVKSSIVDPQTVKLEIVGNFYKQTVTVYAPAESFLEQLETMVGKLRGEYMLKMKK